MSLFEKWKDMAFGHKTKGEFEDFWKVYGGVEESIYATVLENHEEPIEGVLKDLAQKFNTTNEYFFGFIDGINESVKEPLNLEDITENSQIKLEIEPEKLYYNMLEADADYLYTLPKWNEILTDEKRQEIKKAQKSSKTIVKEKKIGRNDPCTCGSGKKYKKCCGK